MPCSGTEPTKCGNCFLDSGLNFLLENAVVEHKKKQAAKVVNIFDPVFMGRMHRRRDPAMSWRCHFFLEILC